AGQLSSGNERLDGGRLNLRGSFRGGHGWGMVAGARVTAIGSPQEVRTLPVRQSEAMSMFGRSISVKGEIRSSEDLTFEGRIEGPIVCETGAVLVGDGAVIVGDIIARDVTIQGRVEGQVVATDVVDVRAGSVVTAQVMS